MDINELFTFIDEVTQELPEKEANRLIELRDSLEDVGLNEWSYKLELFANDMLTKNIGNHEKLALLMAEAERTGSIEIKPLYLLLVVLLVILVVYLA